MEGRPKLDLVPVVWKGAHCWSFGPPRDRGWCLVLVNHNYVPRDHPIAGDRGPAIGRVPWVVWSVEVDELEVLEVLDASG